MTPYDQWLQDEPEPSEIIEDLRDTEPYDIEVDDQLIKEADEDE